MRCMDPPATGGRSFLAKGLACDEKAYPARPSHRGGNDAPIDALHMDADQPRHVQGRDSQGSTANWKALAVEFAAGGLTDADGKAPSDETTRQTWWKVRKTVAARQASAIKRKVKASVEPRFPSRHPHPSEHQQHCPQQVPWLPTTPTTTTATAQAQMDTDHQTEVRLFHGHQANAESDRDLVPHPRPRRRRRGIAGRVTAVVIGGTGPCPHG